MPRQQIESNLIATLSTTTSPTAEQAIQHVYLADYVDPTDEPTSGLLLNFIFVQCLFV